MAGGLAEPMFQDASPRGERRGVKVQVLLCFCVGFCFAVLFNLGGDEQKVTTQDAAVTMAMESMQSTRTQLSQSAMLRPSIEQLKAKIHQMNPMQLKEFEAKKHRCELDAARIAGKVLKHAVPMAGLATACEAFALVDDRLAGEGTGKILGINDPILGYVVVGVFGTIWTLYILASKEMPDDGIGLDGDGRL